MKPLKLLLCLVCLQSQIFDLNGAVKAYRDSAQSCPIHTGNPVLATTPTLTAYDDAILDFLSNGGTSEELQSILIERNIIQPYRDENHFPVNPAFLNRGGIRSADFDGNDYLDIAVALFDPSGSYSGGLFIYMCDGQRFQQIPSPLLYTFDPYTHKPKYVDRAPKFIYAGDMNNDGRAELVFDIGVSGASTIGMDIEIFGWNDQTQSMRSLKADENSYVADGGSYKVANSANGYKVLIVRTGFSGSGVAAGPQRQFIITYAWNGKQFAEVDAVGDPSSSRLHVTYDALAALNHGAFKTATMLYNQVLNNNQLDDWYLDTEAREMFRNGLKAHAAYGLLLVYTKRFGPRSVLAGQAHEQMRQLNVKIGSYLWFKYADLFRGTVQTTKDIHLGCQKVNEAIQADVDAMPNSGPKGIQWLGIWPWFSYNVNWIPTDHGLSFCPL
jgi:hypothetical protein